MLIVSAVLDQDPDVTARLELHALERMVRALCEHTEQLLAEARARGALESREADLQMLAFGERRTEAMRLLDSTASGWTESRIARLEQLVKALDCSRAFFLGTRSTATRSTAS